MTRPSVRRIIRLVILWRRCGSVFRFIIFIVRLIRRFLMMCLTARRTPGFSLIGLLLVIAMIGGLAGRMTQAASQARTVAKRMECGNNLRQLGIAFHVYETTMNVLPTENGSDRTIYRALLPYIEMVNVET